MQIDTAYQDPTLLFASSFSSPQITDNAVSFLAVFFDRRSVQPKHEFDLPLSLLINCHGIARRLTDNPEWIGEIKFTPPSGQTATPRITAGENFSIVGGNSF